MCVLKNDSDLVMERKSAFLRRRLRRNNDVGAGVMSRRQVPMLTLIHLYERSQTVCVRILSISLSDYANASSSM